MTTDHGWLSKFRPSSIERASVMRLRVTKSVKDYPHGTPVLISMDVTGKKRNLKLDGIILTVKTLGCNSLLASCRFPDPLSLAKIVNCFPQIETLSVCIQVDKYRGRSSGLDLL
ncbi:hypothetical protein L2E82_01722 [Cichorium intybus]|uniref:Uncharacterized protein n=1 Tax=Cichorium intybus TaxID=13427 RepID=A0ACB9GZN6_CICIN|nr:hypothetical protein L2E82_01722 [Cichorium intybus]